MDKILETFLFKTNSNLALLLNGKWGIGKTYYLKNVLFPKIRDKNKRVFYISLFGVQNIEEVYTQILSQKFLDPKNKKTKKLVKIAGGIVSTAFKLFIRNSPGGIKMSGDDIEIEFTDFVNIDDSVIFFDDLERVPDTTSFDLLIGQINEAFIQNEKIKVVFVANEDQLAKKHQVFFNVKEKLVGWTVNFDVPVLETNKSIVKSYESHPDYHDYLQEMSDFMDEIIIHFNITNLRTLIFFYDTLEVVNQICELRELTCNQDVFYSVLVLVLEYKRGYFDNRKEIQELPYYIIRRRRDFTITDTTRKEEQRFNKYIFNSLMKTQGFSFSYYFIESVFDLITKGVISENTMKLEVQNIDNSKKEKEKSEISILCSTLQGYFEMTNKEFIDNFERLQHKIERESLTLEDFVTATKTLYYLTRKNHLRVKKDYLDKLLPRVLEEIDCSSTEGLTKIQSHTIDRNIGEIQRENEELSGMIDRKIASCRSKLLQEQFLDIWEKDVQYYPDGFAFRQLLQHIPTDIIIDKIFLLIEDRKRSTLLLERIEKALNLPLESFPDKKDEADKFSEIALGLSKMENEYEYVDAVWIEEYRKAFSIYQKEERN